MATNRIFLNKPTGLTLEFACAPEGSFESIVSWQTGSEEEKRSFASLPNGDPFVVGQKYVFYAREEDPELRNPRGYDYVGEVTYDGFGEPIYDLQKVTNNGRHTDRVINAAGFEMPSLETIEETTVLLSVKTTTTVENGQTIVSKKIVQIALEDVVTGSGPTVPNRPPVVLNPIGNQVGVVGQPKTIPVRKSFFSDPDGDALTILVTGLPTGMAYSEAGEQVEGSPSQAGTFNPTITVKSLGGQESYSFQFTVTNPENANVPPSLVAPLPVITVTTGAPFAPDPLTAALFTDANGVASVVYTPSLGEHPAGVNVVNGGTQLTINIATPGTYTIPVIATDTTGLFSVVNQTIVAMAPAGNPLTMLAPNYGGSDGALQMNVSGGNGSQIYYRIASPAIRAEWGLSRDFNVPAQYRNGTQLLLEAMQSGVIVNRTFTTSSGTANQPPTPGKGLANQTATVGTYFNYTHTVDAATDPEQGLISYIPQPGMPDWMSYGTTARSWFGTPTAPGSFVIKLRCQDPVSAYIILEYTLTVVANPTPPPTGTVVNGSKVKTDVGSNGVNVLLTPKSPGDGLLVNLSRVDGTPISGTTPWNGPWNSDGWYPAYSLPDEPGYSLAKLFIGTNLVTGGQPLKIKVKKSGNELIETFTFTPNPADNDDEVLSSTLAARGPVKNSSQVSMSAITGVSFGGANFQFPSNRFTHPDGLVLTWSLHALTSGNVETTLYAWGSFNASTQQFTGTAPAVGTYKLRLKVTDPNGQTAVDDFVFNSTAIITNPGSTAPTDNVRRLYSTIHGHDDGENPEYDNQFMDFLDLGLSAGANELRLTYLSFWTINPTRWQKYDKWFNKAAIANVPISVHFSIIFYEHKLPSWLPKSKCQQFHNGGYPDQFFPSLSFLRGGATGLQRVWETADYKAGNPFFELHHRWIKPFLDHFGSINGKVSIGCATTQENNYSTGVLIGTGASVNAYSGLEPLQQQKFVQWCQAKGLNYSALPYPANWNIFDSFADQGVGKAACIMRNEDCRLLQEWFEWIIRNHDPSIRIMTDIADGWNRQSVLYGNTHLKTLTSTCEAHKRNLTTVNSWQLGGMQARSMGKKTGAEIDGSLTRDDEYVSGYGTGAGVVAFLDFMNNVKQGMQSGIDEISIFAMNNYPDLFVRTIEWLGDEGLIGSACPAYTPTVTVDWFAEKTRRGHEQNQFDWGSLRDAGEKVHFNVIEESL